MTAALDLRSIPERLVEHLRESIVSGEIPADQPIRQDALAARFQVSKIPLREALARLEQDGLVVSHANRGYAVRPLSWQEAREIYELRLQLEPAAAAHACQHASPDEQAAATDALVRLDAAVTARQPSVGPLNRDFHMALVAPGGRPLTHGIVERLQVLADRYVRMHLEPHGRDVRAGQEHHDMLDAWLARRGDDVRRLVAAHLQGTLRDLAEVLDDAG